MWRKTMIDDGIQHNRQLLWKFTISQESYSLGSVRVHKVPQGSKIDQKGPQESTRIHKGPQVPKSLDKTP